ncbi:MAG: cation transporter [Vicinamibacterales bacterium]
MTPEPSASPTPSVLRLHVAGMDCADEAALIRRALTRSGITALNFDLVGRRVDVTYNPSLIRVEAIVAAVQQTGLAAHSHGAGELVHDDHRPHAHHHDTARWWAAASGAFLAIAWVVELWQGHGDSPLFPVAAPAEKGTVPTVAVAGYALSIVAGLWPMAPRAWASLRHARLDMHVLVCLSAAGAVAIGQWGEGAAVAFLFAVAHLMEAWSIDRARAAVAELVGHEPGWGLEGPHESAPVERWIERFAAVYTPVVTFSAIAVVLMPPLADGQWATWFYRGLIFLVLACPCALVISTPVTVVAAVTSAARRGVLFKGGAPLEQAARARAGTVAALSEAGVVVGRRSDAAASVVSADVVIGESDEDLAFLVNHARRALAVIRQNVALAIATKLAFLVSAVFGASPLWLAVVADTGATVAVTLNGLRLLRASGSRAVA